MFDVGGKGLLSRIQTKTFLDKMGLETSEEEMDGVMTAFDPDNNGLDFFEFTELLRSLVRGGGKG